MVPEISIRIESPLSAEYAWVMRLFGAYVGFTVKEVESGEDILIAEHGMGDIQVSHFFRQIYQSGDYHFKAYFRKEPLHLTASGKPDFLSTSFFLLAYLQEYTDYVPDQYNRFPYQASVQHHFKCVEQNLVAHYFDALYASIPKLHSRITPKKHATGIFLSHDIDHAFGALRQNAPYLLKKGKIGALLQAMFNHYLRVPDQLLLNKIMDIEDAYDVRSVFFWMVNSGKGSRKIYNADYSIDDARVRKMQQTIQQRGWVNGLHKSVSRDTYSGEFDRLGAVAKRINRNHYLLTELPGTFEHLQDAGVQLDATFGFPEVMGFRNSYGLPIKPFDVKRKKAYDFVEVPLHIMDTTLRYYQNCSSKQATNHILEFLSKHTDNAVISILWHNNYFFEAAEPGWVDAYKEVLQFIRDHQLQAILPDTILERYA